MIKIRSKVFETNSSSTHSLCIPENINMELMDNIIPDDNGMITLNGGQFGHNYDEHFDSLTKLNYLAIYCIEWYPEDVELLTTLKKVVKEQTGCKDIIFNLEEEDSYIDHQSVENKEYHFIFENDELLRDFIFNKESSLITDSDG